MDVSRLAVFVLVGAGFSAAALGLSALLRSSSRDPRTRTPYECGMDAEGTPWVSPNIRFYMFALLFVIFDVEALFVFPWAVQLRAFGFAGLAAVTVFAGVLFFGLFYAWKRKALEWK